MAERPILFSSAMVRAIRRGCKTQTRRVAKGFPDWVDSVTPLVSGNFQIHGRDGMNFRDCPYGKVGDLLWVRETWGTATVVRLDSDDISHKTVYRADFPDDYGRFGIEGGWKSPYHMPRNLSRFLLRVTDVRAERLQSISEQDAIAEGCRGYRMDTGLPSGDMERFVYPEEQYKDLWNEINASRGHSWESNPWVWAITFEVVDQSAPTPPPAQEGE